MEVAPQHKGLYINSLDDWIRCQSDGSDYGRNSKDKTISDGGITVDFRFIKVHTSN